MTPEVFTPLLKSCWQLANQLIVNWNKMSLNSNHGAYETMGLSVIAINMNEFNDATKPLESGATPENGGRGGWLDVAGYRFAAMCNKNILADGSGIECSLGYTSETAGNTIRQLSVAKDAGWYDFKLSEAVKEAITKSGKYMVSATGPGFRDFQQGDSQVNDHSYLGSIKSIANEVDDPILKWAATDGKEGKAPDYTSILYPVGRKVILRSGWGNDDIYISSNADGNMGGHGHSDDMVLNMFAYGKYLLADPRYINYDTDNPYRTWQISSRGHNVVEINGFSQKGGGFGWTYGKPIKGPSGENLYMSSGNKYGNIRDSELNGTYDFVKLNSPNNLGIKAVDDKGKAISSSVDYDRDILFLKSGHVIVTDSLKPVDKMGSNNYSLGWHYMPDANVTINPETNVVRTNFNAEANINVAAVSPQSEQVTTIKDGWYSYSTGNVISAKYSSSVKDVAGDTSMNTLLVPEKPGAKTDVLTSDIPLDVDDGAATAFSFLINNKSENSTIDGSYYSVLNPKNQTQRSFGKYTTDGSLALCETENNSYLQLALRNGTNLTSTADNIKLIRASEKIKDVGVNYLASKIDINSAKDINLENIQLYSGNKKISEVRLNGKAVSFKQDKQKGDIYFGATMPFLGNEIENTHSPDNPGGGTGGGNHATGGGNGSGGGVIPPTPTQAPGTTEKPSDKFSAELKNHWGKIEISEMVDLGIVKGVSDTSLGLLDNTTRAEFMAMCLRSKNIKLDEYNGEFKDVFGDEWYAPYIATAKNLGILEGDGVNASPNAFVTRA
ncbi:MAG: heparinase II/III family protein, partial [Oscillospiraceae bacterium]